jgi:ABC-type glycerol-3-phosphate transport system substrate-binding protein
VDDMAEMGIKLTRDRSGDGEIDTWGIWIETGGWFYWPRMWGGGIVNPDDDTDCWLDEPTSQGAYQWIYRNQWEREPNILIRDEQGGGWYDGLVSELIAIDEMGMYPAQTAEKVGDLFQWAYREPPAGPAGKCSLGDADGWSIWKGTKNPEACWELIYFLSSPVFQELGTLRAEGAIPIRKSLMPLMYEVFAEEFPALANVDMEVVGQMLDKGYLSNVHWFKKQAAADEIIGPAMEAVFAVGEKDPSYFKEICSQVEATQK